MTLASGLMTKEIIKVKTDMLIEDAFNLMKQNGIRHLPVVDPMGKLVGILSDRDIQRAVKVRMRNAIEQEMVFNFQDKVESFMSWPVETFDENTSIETITRKMIEMKVSSFVISSPQQYIKGIVTTDDLLKYLLELLNNTDDVVRSAPIGQFYWGNVEN